MIVILQNLNFLKMEGQITIREKKDNKESEPVTYNNDCGAAFISLMLKKDSVSKKFPSLHVQFQLKGGECYGIFEIPSVNYEKWCPLNNVNNDHVYSDCWHGTADFDINDYNIQNDYVIVNIYTKWDQIFNCIRTVK